MKLNRKTHVAQKHPVRIVHMGLGAFHRAHQVWFTHEVDIEGEWGIASFTGRNPEAAIELAQQDGLFTLITRSATEDTFIVIDSISEALDGSDIDTFNSYISDPLIAIVTLTITEAGYSQVPGSAMSRLARALDERRKKNGKGIAIISCDNLPQNAKVVSSHLSHFFNEMGSESIEWFAANVSIVSTSIDRITPRTNDSDIASVTNATSFEDASPVVTEPFSSWILQGEFPEGRPAWEKAGAKFVRDITPYENRKLWLLNGAHSLLAYAGLAHGHATVDQAVNDPILIIELHNFWDEASTYLTEPGLDIETYKKALFERFENPRIAHSLEQIAIDGSLKLAARIAPIALAELKRDRIPRASIKVFAHWINFARSADSLHDAQKTEIQSALSSDKPEENLVNLVNPQLSHNSRFMSALLKELSLTPMATKG